MLYFIHSPKQTNLIGRDQYWQANENGYTSVLANAGVYTEEDKERISKRSNEWGATFVPITKELIQQAKVQLQERIEEYDKRIEQENARHIAEIQRLNEIKSQYSALSDLSHLTVEINTDQFEIEVEGEER